MHDKSIWRLIDLILFSFMPFSYTRVYFRPSYPIPPPLHFQALSEQLLLFLRLLLFISVFCSSTQIWYFFFAQIECDENCYPSYRNFRIFLDCVTRPFSLVKVTLGRRCNCVSLIRVSCYDQPVLIVCFFSLYDVTKRKPL